MKNDTSRASQKFIFNDKNSEEYKLLENVCIASGEIYNHTLEVVKRCIDGDFDGLEEFQELFLDKEVTKLFKSNGFRTKFASVYSKKFNIKDNPELTVMSGRWTVIKCLTSIGGFYGKLSRMDWKKEKDIKISYNNPNFPKPLEKGVPFYCKFDGESVFKDGFLQLRKKMKNRSAINIPFNIPTREIDGDRKYVEVYPRNYGFKISIFVDRNLKDYDLDENKYLSIDLGIDNFISMISSDGSVCELINGGELSSKIQYFGQRMAKVQSMYDKQGIKEGPAKQAILLDYENFVENFLHKTSKYVVDLMIKHKIKNCVVGKNKNWKLKSKISDNKRTNRKFNKTFCKMPHASLLSKLEYKIKDIGGNFITIREDNTSMCSAYDGEMLPCGNKFTESKKIFKGSRGIRRGNEVIVCKGKRGRLVEIHYDPTFKTRKGKTVQYHTIKKNHKGEKYLDTVRGLFFTADNNQIVNSDINGAFNILKKYFIAKDKNLDELTFHKSFFNPEKKYIPL